MERDGFSCRICGAEERTLNVHHKIYYKGRHPWEYHDDELVTLCEECHARESAMMRELREALARLEFGMLSRVLDYTLSLEKFDRGGPVLLRDVMVAIDRKRA